ncbi:MAG: AMP-binding protein [Gammaproteobacteria bacterium]
MLITADEGLRGGRKVPLKANADAALEHCPNVTTCLVVRHTGGHINWNEKHDIWYHAMAEKVDADCPAEEMDAEDPLFIPYTSGSTGKTQVGVLHTTAGYLLGAAMTHKYVLDYREGDIYSVYWLTWAGSLAFLHCVWPAGQRRHHPDVRRGADLSRCLAPLAGDRQACGQHLHTAPTAIRAPC